MLTPLKPEEIDILNNALPAMQVVKLGSKLEKIIEGVHAGDGDVTGPSSSFLNTIPRFADTTGKIIKTSGIEIDDLDNVAVPGNMAVRGNLSIKGTTVIIDSEIVNISDNHLYLNAGYIVPVAEPSGIVCNYLPTSLADSVVAGTFTAGVAVVSNPTVTTVGSGTFAISDIIQIFGSAENDGVYEVLQHVANTLTIRGIGLIPALLDFVQNQFTSNASENATITKINATVIQAGRSGGWEVAKGSSVGEIAFHSLVALSDTVALTSGSVPFINSAGNLIQNNADLFWDDINKRLEIGGLNLIGSISKPIELKTANYTFTDSDYTIKMDASGGDRLAFLPTAVGRKGRIYILAKIDVSVNTVTWVPDGTEKIGKSSSIVLKDQDEAAKIQSDGINWVPTGEIRQIDFSPYVNTVTINSPTYTVGDFENILNVAYSTTGVCTITIPTSEILKSRYFLIKDSGGEAKTNDIIINSEGSETFDGDPNFTIDLNYGSAIIYSDGTNLFIKA